MNPSRARHVAYSSCWSKVVRTIDGAAARLADLLHAGNRGGTVYRCPFSPPAEEPHYHVSTHPRNFSGEHQERALAVLGDSAYRSVDEPPRRRGPTEYKPSSTDS